MKLQLRWVLIAAAIALWFAAVAHGVFGPSADARQQVWTGVRHVPELLTHLPRNAGYVLPVLLFLLSGFGIGDCICSALRARPANAYARLALALCIGQACWLAATIAIGMPGLLDRPVVWTLFAAGLASSAWRWYVTRSEWKSADTQSTSHAPMWLRLAIAACVAVLAFDLYLALLGALMPETGFDARFYHLAEAKRYADHGALYNLAASQHSVELALPQNQEILYAAVIKLFGLPAAKVLSWSNLLLVTLASIGFAGEFFASEAAGVFAALLFVTTPIVTSTATTASNDLSQAPYALLALYAFFAWNRDRGRTGWLVAAGLLCGFSFGIKPFTFFTILVLGGFIGVLAFPRTPRALAAFAVGCVLGALPDFVREAAVTGDPFFPIGAGLVHSPFWWPSQEQVMRQSIHAFGADTSWPVLFKLPWALTMQADRYRNLLGPLFLFVTPLVAVYALWPRANAAFRTLTAFVAVWIVLWFCTGYVEARYAESLFPAVTLLAAFLIVPAPNGALAGAARWICTAALVFIALANTPLLVPLQRSATLGWVSGTVNYDWPYLFHGRPESELQLNQVPMLEYINEHLDRRKDKVYVDGVDMYYNVYSDVDLYDGVAARDEGFSTWDLTSPDAFDRVRAAGIDYVAIPAKAEPALQASPLYRHLDEIVRLPPGPLSSDALGQAQILYRVVNRTVRPQPIAPAGFYRHSDEPSVYRLSPDHTYCVVLTMEQLGAFGAVDKVNVVAPTSNFLRGYRPIAKELGCPWPTTR